MILTAIVNETPYQLDVPEEIVHGAQDFFAKMDEDMSQGWQMSRTWVEAPNKTQRCQIASDKLLTALETQNEKLTLLMAGYILHTMPGVVQVDIDTSGEMMNTTLTMGEPQTRPAAPVVDLQEHREKVTDQPITNKLEAIEQAGKEVTKVYKVGRGYRFATYDRKAEQWIESPVTKNQEEAQRFRMKAYEERLQALLKAIQ